MPQSATVSVERVTSAEIALPPANVSLCQDREWCVVKVDGKWKKIRFHDYDEVYAIPGLYETLFQEVLRCNSPRKITEMLNRCLEEARINPGDLRVLDLGAGNGMAGEELARIGVRRIVGVDIIQAAADAARRDRRDLYDDYFVVDMTDIPRSVLLRFDTRRLNCLVSVAALGFGDIPPAAFANAYNLIARGGWVAFNIKSAFLESDGGGGFASLIRRMISEDLISIRADTQYQHRRATDGESLLYTAVVGVKNGNVPATWEM
jgi:SAM-dependent methyltransferase